jgi:hypothetical protein
MSEIKTKPVTKAYNDEFNRIFGDRPLPSGGKKIYDSNGNEINQDYPWAFRELVEIQTQDIHGNWVNAKPIGLICEYPGCTNEVTHDEKYERVDKNLPNGWGDEPEILCAEHSVGRTQYRLTK